MYTWSKQDGVCKSQSERLPSMVYVNENAWALMPLPRHKTKKLRLKWDHLSMPHRLERLSNLNFDLVTFLSSRAQCAEAQVCSKMPNAFLLLLTKLFISSCWPGSEKMKPKCDMEVKKSKSEVMLGLHISWNEALLNWILCHTKLLKALRLGRIKINIF